MIKLGSTLLVWLGFAAAASAQGVANEKLDPVILEKLQGAWEVVSEERDGQQTPQAFVDAMPTVTFTGNTYRWGNGETGRIVAIDAAKKPMWIDYLYTSGPRNGQIDRAIIQIDGDTFMDCMPDPIGPRPDQFSTFPGDGRTLMTYRRVSEERGNGLILNPVFYAAICFGVGTLGIVFVTVVVILTVWLGNRATPAEVTNRGRQGSRRSL